MLRPQLHNQPLPWAFPGRSPGETGLGRTDGISGGLGWLAGTPQPRVSMTVGGEAGGAGVGRPVPTPGSSHTSGPALRRRLRVSRTLLPHPHALHGSKVKIKGIMMRARLARGRRDFTFPQLRRPDGTPRAVTGAPLAPTYCPQEKRHKGTAPSGPGGRSFRRLPAPVCPEAGGWPLQITEQKATPVGPLRSVVLNSPTHF